MSSFSCLKILELIRDGIDEIIQHTSENVSAWNMWQEVRNMMWEWILHC